MNESESIASGLLIISFAVAILLPCIAFTIWDFFFSPDARRMRQLEKDLHMKERWKEIK